MAKNDCYNCGNRKVGCHLTCESYKQFKAKNDEGLKAKELARIADSLQVERSIKKKAASQSRHKFPLRIKV